MQILWMLWEEEKIECFIQWIPEEVLKDIFLFL
jgi:hypothetical protein